MRNLTPAMTDLKNKSTGGQKDVKKKDSQKPDKKVKTQPTII